jgi:hypothetical protein
VRRLGRVVDVRSGWALRSGTVGWAHLSIASWWEEKADWSSLRKGLKMRLAPLLPGLAMVALAGVLFSRARYGPFGNSE